jgi:hypothetical protein
MCGTQNFRQVASPSKWCAANYEKSSQPMAALQKLEISRERINDFVVCNEATGMAFWKTQEQNGLSVLWRSNTIIQSKHDGA